MIYYSQFLVGEVVFEAGQPPFLAGEILVLPKFHGYHHVAATAALPWRWRSVVVDLCPQTGHSSLEKTGKNKRHSTIRVTIEVWFVLNAV